MYKYLLLLQTNKKKQHLKEFYLNLKNPVWPEHKWFIWTPYFYCTVTSFLNCVLFSLQVPKETTKEEDGISPIKTSFLSLLFNFWRKKIVCVTKKKDLITAINA